MNGNEGALEVSVVSWQNEITGGPVVNRQGVDLKILRHRVEAIVRATRILERVRLATKTVKSDE